MALQITFIRIFVSKTKALQYGFKNKRSYQRKRYDYNRACR